MTAKALAAIAAAIAIAALLAPTAAAARTEPTGRGHNPTVTALLGVFGSNGYLIGATLVNRTKLKILTLGPQEPALVTTEYKLDAPQPPGSNEIKASLGKLGRIDVRFVPDSASEVEPLLPVCKGEMDKVEVGRFVGLFEFRGEHGYTRTRVKQAGGSVTVAPAPTCHPHPLGRSPHEQARAALSAMARRAANPGAHLLGLKATMKSPSVKFEALRFSTPDKHGKERAFDTFLVTASRDRGRIHEESSALALLLRGPYFKVPDLTHLTSEAVLKPPAPFRGSATLRREPSSKAASWTGDLRVKLPGFGVVPLAGPGTRATLCADSGCRTKK